MTRLIPLLFEPGDRMSLDEFLERWEQMPELKFAELIDGVVYMVPHRSHDHALHDSHVRLLMGTYATRTRVCECLADPTWLMLSSAPQPDTALRLLPEFGGKTRIERNLATGSPELVAEVCRSSRSYDLGPKLALYQRAGVAEYIAVLLEERRIDWRRLEAGSYRILQADRAGLLKSSVYPGLWIDEQAFWAEDSSSLLAALEDGLRSAESHQFLAQVGAKQP